MLQILLGIIRIASGINVLEFANEYLFKPLGIETRVNAMLFILIKSIIS